MLGQTAVVDKGRLHGSHDGVDEDAGIKIPGLLGCGGPPVRQSLHGHAACQHGQFHRLRIDHAHVEPPTGRLEVTSPGENEQRRRPFRCHIEYDFALGHGRLPDPRGVQHVELGLTIENGLTALRQFDGSGLMHPGTVDFFIPRQCSGRPLVGVPHADER